MEQQDIEIKKIQAKEVAVSTKRTLYVCVVWYSNGRFYANSPTDEKRDAEDYAFSMSKHGHTSIYSFEINVPTNK
ncbi:hypothetical protein [Microcystis sp. M061S2]|uniref:hypothetical protein n=1 Tax=Microcystis sp. M061S2 TaxID=2771171 RepID=UPI0025874D68|nr:hypothetical protein [Microcystis sp. M061S2]MCA2656608.1 hypothetical protein [Microcystis sp. M061S2]